MGLYKSQISLPFCALCLARDLTIAGGCFCADSPSQGEQKKVANHSHIILNLSCVNLKRSSASHIISPWARLPTLPQVLEIENQLVTSIKTQRHVSTPREAARILRNNRISAMLPSLTIVSPWCVLLLHMYILSIIWVSLWARMCITSLMYINCIKIATLKKIERPHHPNPFQTSWSIENPIILQCRHSTNVKPGRHCAPGVPSLWGACTAPEKRDWKKMESWRFLTRRLTWNMDQHW